MADTVVPAETRLGAGSDFSARLQQVLALLFPSNFAAKAVLFAVVVALLPLLPTSQAPRIWELPHILLLGLVISYGVFGQRNADAEVAAAKLVDDDESVESYVSQVMQGPLVFEGNGGDGDSNGGVKDGVQAWSSQYYPDDPLIVVDMGSGNGKGGESEKPLLLPVRKLKPAAEESPTGYAGDGIEEDEAEFLAPKERYGGVREHAMPSPSSVLDADLTLSPCSPPLPPPPPPFHGAGCGLRKVKARSFNEYVVRDRSTSGRAGLHGSGGGGGNKFRSNSATQARRRSTFAGYDPDHPVAPFDDQAAAEHELDEMVAAASDSSFSSDMVTDGDGDDDDDDKEEDNYDEDEDEQEKSSCDEELFELATRPGPEAEEEEDEVDRKADEFIAKFREQIRMQRVEPGRR